jgi:Nucleoside-diphosphate-sugar epimerases
LHPEYARKISALRGPILILGASGFIGANLLRHILEIRKDVVGTAFGMPAWRLEDVPQENTYYLDLLVAQNLETLLDQVAPSTVFDCVAYGAYSFEQDSHRIYETNIMLKVALLDLLCERGTYCYIHAGSSSEYGVHADGPLENAALEPNSQYSVSKAAVAGLLQFTGKQRGLRCANLRFYSVYGPLEERSRLIPSVIVEGAAGRYPSFVDPDITRDFVYVEDACEAFAEAALALTPAHYGDSFNIGSGRATSIAELAETAQTLFAITTQPEFASMEKRKWDFHGQWRANTTRTAEVLGWRARTSLSDGLARTAEWVRQLPDPSRYDRSAKGFVENQNESISAIIACYKDAQAIPIMYDRLVKVFEKLHIDYEIIFVNDGSPDNSQEVIQEISRRNRRVIGITHSRNFSSQSAFRSGLEISKNRACVLLDGDLQDPPELIEQFVAEWRKGYEVVYGRRVQREAPLLMQLSYKLFYRLFHQLSYVDIPRDAGDFSLIDRKVVRWILNCQERDFFLRGVRAFVGFRQTGVDYIRPERVFGKSTNNMWRSFGWAKKGILSFSNVPLNTLTGLGILSFIAGAVLSLGQIVAKLLFPSAAPRGFTTVILLVLVLGSLNLLAIGIVGEYIAKILEEVKARPHFIRLNIIRSGEVRQADIRRGNNGA